MPDYKKYYGNYSYADVQVRDALWLDGGTLRIDLGGDVAGDLLVRGALGLTQRLAPGSEDQVLTMEGGMPVWKAGYSDAMARQAISLTTTGTSGLSTYNAATGVLNIPNYTIALQNGLNLNGGIGRLGGNLEEDTTLSLMGYEFLVQDGATSTSLQLANGTLYLLSNSTDAGASPFDYAQLQVTSPLYPLVTIEAQRQGVDGIVRRAISEATATNSEALYQIVSRHSNSSNIMQAMQLLRVTATASFLGAIDPTTLQDKGLLVNPAGDLRLHNYPSSRDDGATTKALYVDSSGNLRYGAVAGSGGGAAITLNNGLTYNSGTATGRLGGTLNQATAIDLSLYSLQLDSANGYFSFAPSGYTLEHANAAGTTLYHGESGDEYDLTLYNPDTGVTLYHRLQEDNIFTRIYAPSAGNELQVSLYRNIDDQLRGHFIMSTGSDSIAKGLELMPTKVFLGVTTDFDYDNWLLSGNGLEINNSGDLRLTTYPSARNDGATTAALYVDGQGNVKLGPIAAAPLSGSGNYIWNQYTTYTGPQQARMDLVNESASMTFGASGATFAAFGRGVFSFTITDSVWDFQQDVNRNGFTRFRMKGNNNGAGAAVGLLFENETGKGFQLYHGSDNNTLAGTLTMLRNFGGGGIRIASDNGILRFDTGAFGTERARITNIGNLLLGTTTDDGQKLQVQGTARVSTLGGSGTRLVQTDNNGVLSIGAPPLSLTTTGTSGVATYDAATGVLNVPNYAIDTSGYIQNQYSAAQSAEFYISGRGRLSHLHVNNAGADTDARLSLRATGVFGAYVRRDGPLTNSGGIGLMGVSVIDGSEFEQTAQTVFTGLRGQIALLQEGDIFFDPTSIISGNSAQVYFNSAFTAGGLVSAYQSDINLAGSGSVYAVAAFRAFRPQQAFNQAAFSGTVDSFYGIYFDDYQAAGFTGNISGQIDNIYAVYQAGPGDKNFWAGDHWLDKLKNGTSDQYLGIDSTGKVKVMATPSGGGGTYTGADFIQNQNAAVQTANFRISGSGEADSLIVNGATLSAKSPAAGYAILFNTNNGSYESIELGFPSQAAGLTRSLKFVNFGGDSFVWADTASGAITRYLKLYSGSGVDLVTGSNNIRLRATGTGNILIGSPTDDGLNKLQVTGSVRVSTLAGTGDRMVVADTDGKLTTQGIPSGGSTLNGTGFVRMSGTTPSYISGTASQFLKGDGTLDSTTYLTANEVITWTASGDVSGSASGATVLSAPLQVTGLRGAALPTLATGYLRYNGSAWVYDNSTFLTTTTAASTYQPLDGDLTAIAALAGTAGLLRKTAADTWSLDTATYLTANQSITVSGDASGSGTTAIALTLATVNSNVGTFNNVTVNGKGLVTAASNVAYLTANQSITLSGDISGTGTTAITTAIGANKVTLAMMAQVATATFLGRTTAATGNVEALTATQATALLDVFNTTLKGLVPASGGGTTNFLRADGTWAAPPSGGTTLNGTGFVRMSGTTPSYITGTASQFLKGDGTLDSATYLTAYTETDPVFTASAAAGITATNITNWNTVARPATQVVVGAGTGLTSSSAFTFNGTLLSLTSNATTGYVLEYTVGSVLRTRLQNNGIQEWYLNSDNIEIGSVRYATPSDLPGIQLFNSAGNGRTQIRMLGSSGGFAFGSTSGNAIPTNHFTMTTGGVVTFTTLSGTGNRIVVADANGAITGYTAASATALLDVFNTTLKGLVPASGGGTTNFLRADGTWAAPPSGGTTLNGTGFVYMSGTTPSYITGTASQFLKGDGTLDSNTYLTANQSITVSGDASGSGTTAIALTLATVNSNVGTFNNVTVNGKGLVTAASNVAYLTANQSITLSGDISGTGTTAITTAIGANKVTLAMMAQVATATFLGRTTTATGNVEALTATQATAMLDVFNTTLKGLVPASGGGTTNFLRADGQWAAPPSGGTTLNGTGYVRMSGTTPSYVTGTASQFLKADGSLDSTTYLTAAITSIGPSGSLQNGGAITLATGTTGTDFGISASSNTITFNIPDASASARGLVTTAAQTFAGLKTFNGGIASATFALQSFVTSVTDSWLGQSRTTSILSRITNNASFSLFSNESVVLFRLLNTAAITTGSSGTHSFVSYLAIKPLTVDASATTPAPVTNAATLYVEGATTGTATITNNYAFWVDAGTTRLDGNLELQGIASTTTANVLYYDSTTKQVSYGAAPSGSGTTLNGTGFVRMSGTTPSYITGTSSQFLKADGTVDSSVTSNGTLLSITSDATTGNAMEFTVASVLRSRMVNNGIQEWYLNSGGSEIGSARFATPSDFPGLQFYNASGNGRTQIRMLGTSGGFALGSTTGFSAPTNHFTMDTNGAVTFTTLAGTGNRMVVADANGAITTQNIPSGSQSVVTLSADVTNNNATANTLQDVTGLSFAVVSGSTYYFRFFIWYTAAATTTGSRWTINGPATTALTYRSEYSLTTTSRTFNEGVTAYGNPSAANATSAATTGNVAIIEGVITPSANGTVIARFASEVANSAIVAKAKSYVTTTVL